MKNELEDFLRTNRGRLDNKTPDPAVLDRILEHMQAKHGSKPKKAFIPYRKLLWTAACFILVVCGIAFWILQNRPRNIAAGKPGTSDRREIAGRRNDSIATRPAEPPGRTQPGPGNSITTNTALPPRKQPSRAETNLPTLQAAKQSMLAGLSNMESPASRINAAYYADGLTNTDNDVVDALVATLDTDPSANVRLAMLDALARFYQEGYVRKKLVSSLKKQQDPVVQIALINLLTGMREPGTIEELTRIVKDDNTLNAVRDCAYSGILRLRSS